jgi:hypothetical protein
MYFYAGDQKLATTTPQMEVPQGGDTPVLIGFTNTNIHLWLGSKKLAGSRSARLGSHGSEALLSLRRGSLEHHTRGGENRLTPA